MRTLIQLDSSPALAVPAGAWPGAAAATVSLDMLAPGAAGRVVGLAGLAPDAAERLLELGFDEGAWVEVLHLAALGDPIAVRVDGSTVALRRALARGVEVVPG